MIHKINNYDCLNELHDHIELKKSNIENAGLGVFARTDIPSNTLLGWYRGQIIEGEDLLIDKDYSWSYTHSYLGKVRIEPVVSYPANPLCYVNGVNWEEIEQQDLQNCKMITVNNRLYYITIKEIKKGTELIVDYGKRYFRFRKIIKIEKDAKQQIKTKSRRVN